VIVDRRLPAFRTVAAAQFFSAILAMGERLESGFRFFAPAEPSFPRAAPFLEGGGDRIAYDGV
jgi:hypothetical protein